MTAKRLKSAFQVALMASVLASTGACAKVKVETDFDRINLGKNAINIQSLTIALDPQQPMKETVGKLSYRGGVFLHSRDKRFGGFSAMMVSPDGNAMLAVSDAGYWLRAELDYDKGRLSAVRKAWLAPILDKAGAPLGTKGTADAEGLAAASDKGLDGDVYVSFERDHRVWVYPFGTAGFAARPSAEVTLPADFPRKTVNGGIEGLVRLDDQRLFTIAEDMRDRQDDLTGWLLPAPGASGAPDVVFWEARGDYKVTDLALLPDGDVLVLERSFSLERGAGMALRRLKRSAIEPQAVLDGEVLAELDVRYSIDNMEGLAVRQSETGETLIYVLSDDNFNGLQRTVLLMFALMPDRPAAAAAAP